LKHNANAARLQHNVDLIDAKPNNKKLKLNEMIYLKGILFYLVSFHFGLLIIIFIANISIAPHSRVKEGMSKKVNLWFPSSFYLLGILTNQFI
jgi:hypothetical protein